MSDTLIGRQEKQGRYFPMWIEKILFLAVIAAVYLFHSDIANLFESQGAPNWLIFAAEWLLLPICLLILSELISRLIQFQHSD